MSKSAGTRTTQSKTLRLADADILRLGGEALRKRLGRIGELRYLVLVAGGRDRFEDLRQRWAGISLEEIEEEIT